MNTLNSNLKSLLDHAIMVDDCKYNVPYKDNTGYGVIKKSDIIIYGCFIYEPGKTYNFTVDQNDITHTSIIYNTELSNNIKSLLLHYMSCFNLPESDTFIFTNGTIYRCLPRTGDGLYELSYMFWLSSLVNLHNKFYNHHVSSYIACNFS